MIDSITMRVDNFTRFLAQFNSPCLWPLIAKFDSVKEGIDADGILSDIIAQYTKTSHSDAIRVLRYFIYNNPAEVHNNHIEIHIGLDIIDNIAECIVFANGDVCIYLDGIPEFNDRIREAYYKSKFRRKKKCR